MDKAAPPTPGHAPPDTTAVSLKALLGTMLSLATISVILRFFSRKRQKARLLADDWLTIPVLITFIGGSACFLHMVTLRALGYSSFEVPKSEVMKNRQETQTISVVGNILYTFALGCVKCSLLFLYKRVFCVSQRKAAFNIIIIVTLVLMSLWTVSYVIFIAFQCRDRFSALWDGTQPQYCQWAFPIIYSGAISDFIFDVWILLLPIPLILKLHTTPSRKVSLIAIFLLACISLAASITRVVIYTEINNAGAAAYRMDHQRQLTRAVFYMALELGIAAVAINLPSIWVAFVNFGPETIVRSVRSVVSLASVGSRGSGGSRDTRNNTEARKSATSISSAAPLPVAHQNGKADEEEFDLEALKKARGDGIHVKHDVKVTHG